jgi:hypothetical protein
MMQQLSIILQSVNADADLDEYEPDNTNCFTILLSKLKATPTGFTKHVHLSRVSLCRGPSGEKQISGRNFHKISGQFQDIFGVKTSQ